MRCGKIFALVAIAAASSACSLLADYEQYTSGGGVGGVAGSGGSAAAGKSGAGGSGGKSGTAGVAHGGTAGGGGGTTAGGGGGTTAGGSAGKAGGGGAGGGGGSGTGVVANKGDPCTMANALACVGNNQKLTLICDANTMTWIYGNACSGAQNCDTEAGPLAGTCQPVTPACMGKKPGDIVCDGANRVACGPDLVTEKMLATCSDAAHCAQGTGNTCATCITNEAQCQGADLFVCNPQKTGFTKQQTCASAALCDAAMGKCDASGCPDGPAKCTGDLLQICKPDLTGYDAGTMCNPGLCDAAKKQCDVCTPLATSCSPDGTQVVTCSADGKSSTSMPCTGATPVCSGGKCVECNVPSDCMVANECQTPTCNANTCGVSFVGQGTATSAQSPNDCKQNQCDGAGNIVSVPDPTDLPLPDGNPCHRPACDGSGMPSFPNVADGTSCPTGACISGACSQKASCNGLAPTCGPSGNDDCCATVAIPGGTFGRGYDASGNSTAINGWEQTPMAAPATLSGYSLDVYEVTVGRFRKFVEAFPASLPPQGAGAYAPQNASPRTYPGWDPSWSTFLPGTQAAYKSRLACSSGGTGVATWTDTPGGNESLPITCVSWFDAAAFCAWDGGHLPSEAQWGYAAVGGTEYRAYPWDEANAGSLAISPSNATYGCTSNCTLSNLHTVGALPGGVGKWGNMDLSGNVWEWTLDWIPDASTYVDIAVDKASGCVDCANFDAKAVVDLVNGTNFFARRGGAYDSPAAYQLRSVYRFGYASSNPAGDTGIRCAR